MRSIKLYAGTDYDFRPESYRGPARSPLEAALPMSRDATDER